MKTAPKNKAEKSSLKLKAGTKVRRAASKPAPSNGKHPPTTYEHAPIGIVECSLDGKYINVNEEFCRITGYEKQELLKRGIKDITHEDEAPIDIKLHQKLIAGDIPFYRLEKRYVRKEGGIIWAELTRSVVHDADGKALYTIGVVLDISERKHVERVLRDSSERLRLATETARMFTWELDFKTQIYTLADNFVQVLGFSAGLLPKNSVETVYKLTPAEDIQIVLDLSAKAIQSHSDLHSLQCRVINPENGQVVWLEVNAKIVYDYEGNPERMFGVAQNITANKKAQDEIAIISRMPAENPNPIMRLTPDGKALYANNAGASLLDFWKQQGNQTIPNELQKYLAEVFTSGLKRELEIEHGGKTFFATLAPIREAGYVNFYGSDITERKQAEAQIEFQAYLLENVHDAVIATDNKLRINAWNRAAEQLYGWTAAEAMGRPGAEVVQSELTQEQRASIMAKIDKVGHYTFETIHHHRDARAINVEVHGVPLRTRDNQIVGYITSVQNITARKRAEQALAEFAQQQEALYQLADQLQRTNSLEDVFNAALDAILSSLQCDRASILLYDNTDVMRFVAWRGLSDDYRKATDGHSPWKPDAKNPEPICMNDIDTADLSDSLRAVIKKEGIGSLAFMPLVVNGKLIGKFMTYYNTPHVFDEDEVDFSLTIAHQLAFGVDRTRAEEKLRKSEARFRSYFELGLIGMAITSPSKCILEVNDEICKILGYERSEILTKTWTEMTHPDDLDADMIQFNRVLAREIDAYSLDKRWIRKDGKIIDSTISVRAVHRSDGSVDYFVALLQDITERKRAQSRLTLLAEISELTRRLEDSNELLFAVSKAVGEHLQVRRCLFNEIDLENDREMVHRDYCRGVESVAGMHKVSDYSSITTTEMVTGKTVVNHDSKIDPRTAPDYERSYLQYGERAYVTVPLMRESRWVASLWVSDDMPRLWSKEEVSLLETIADRTWIAVEKLRINAALRASESLYRTIARSIPGGGIYVVDKDMRYLVAEGIVTEAFGLSREMLEGHTVSEIFRGENKERLEEHLRRAFAGQITSSETVRKGHVYWSQYAPLVDSLGQAIVVTLDITERKQVEEALRQSEERFVQFMQHLPGLAWIKDMQGRYVYANAAAEKAFNAPREKLYGQTDQDIFPPEVAAQFKKNDEQTLTDEKGVQVIETLKQDDGVLHHSLVSKFPIPGPDGNTALIGGTAFDITERLQAEEALRESEERFRAILRQATAGIVRKDAEGRLIFVNQAFCNMLGYTESELLGKTIWELMHNEDIEENKRLYDRMMVEGVPFKLERRLIREDGSILWADASVSPIMDIDGKPQSAVAVEVDITARKQAEEALHQLNLQLEDRVQKRTATIQAINRSLRDEIAERKKVEEALRTSEATARLLLNTAPDGVVITDKTGVIAHANAQIASLFGYQPDEILGKQIEVLIPERFHDLHVQHRRTYNNQQLKRVMGLGMDLFGRRKNGDEFPVDVMLTPVSNISDWDVMVTIRDNTERKEMESALRKSHERLRILSQRLVEVQEEERRALARELHDRVGQTLAALNINLIIIGSQLSTDVAQQIGTRLNDSMKLVAETIALVRDVMTDLRPAVLDDYGLEAALESHVDKFKSRYDINVRLEKSDSLIPRLGPSIEMTLLRIAQEALMNIARHAHANEVKLSLREEKDAIHMTVEDNGIGIESWQEANRPGSHGLTIMRERAEAFGGNLKVRSVLGQGTKVEVSIPITSQKETWEEKLL